MSKRRGKKSYMVFAPSRLNDRGKKILDVELRARKRHRQTKVLDVSGMSNVQVYAQVKRAKPNGILLLGGDVLTRFRPRAKITAMHGWPFMLDVKRKGQGVLTVATFHPAATKKKRKWAALLADDVQQFFKLADLDHPTWSDDWPGYCVIAECQFMVDHYDYEGVPFCEYHWAGPEPEVRGEQGELFAA